MRNVLFICSRNRLRSPTAEAVFATWPDVETDSAGLDHDAIVRLPPEQIEWADLIFVTEASHRNKLGKQFRQYLKGKRVIILGIPDNYTFMASELVALLNSKVGRYLR